jgi:hypothetical protein
MLKDPNNNAVTPYELLGLGPDAPSKEVQQALPRFVRDRKNGARVGQAQEAVRKLQNARARAAIDIWFYHLDVSQMEAAIEGPAPLKLDDFYQVPVIAPEELHCDLEKSVMEADFRTIMPAQVKFSDVKIFDGLEAIRLQPEFDR